MSAKFITAPDKISHQEPASESVLIVDADWHDIEAITIFCMTQNVDIDFYIYGPTSIDTTWLTHAVDTVDTILVNNKSDRQPHIKANLDTTRTISMGLDSDEYKVPLDYIIKQTGIK